MLKFQSFFTVTLLNGVLVFLFSSCFSSGPTSAARSFKPNEVEVRAQEDGIQDLTMYLRQVAGVQVSGERESANITIRGINSINMDTSPLFIVDGNNMGRNYGQVYTMINILDVQRITVLKSASELGIYGVQGANGVIEIEMKR